MVGVFDKLVTLKNRYKDALTQIKVQLKWRYGPVPNFIEIAKGYVKHERKTLEVVIEASTA